MKKILFILLVSGLILGSLGGGCGWSAAQVARGILGGQLKIKNWELKITRWCFGGLPLVNQLDRLLDNKTYVVLLQNNTELRASGGFMGSYVVLGAKGQGLSDMRVEDIYQPDGQLVGHVDPPAPIQQAFGQGWWKLRDSNWDVDFSVAGEQIAWFFEQGGEKVDGVIAINLSFVNLLLGYLGEVKTVTYDERVTAQNLANLAQTYSEVNKEKRDFLGAVGAALFERIKTIGPMGQIRLIGLIYKELQNGQILIWMKDKDVEQEILEKGWGGGLGNYGGDYLYIVESNLGANKANCCVQRMITQDLQLDEHVIREKLTIKWTNTSEFSDPKPPVFWGGNYVDYLRIILPKSARIQSVMAESKLLVEKPLDYQYGIQDDRYQVEEKDRFKIIGFWAVVLAQQSLTIQASYQLPDANYSSILVKRQPGIESFPYKLIVEGKVVVSDTIDRVKEYTWTK